MKSGVYTIRNRVDGKVYVGFAKDMSDRLSDHKKELRGNRHPNGYLSRAVEKYGIENFEFEPLIYCERWLLPSEEHYWCNTLKAYDRDFGYNIAPTHPDGKWSMLPESIEKIKASRKANPVVFTKEMIDRRRETLKTSERFKNRRFDGMKGKKHTEETKKKMSEKMTGRKYSEERKQRLRVALKGKIQPKHAVESRLATMKANGYKHSAERNWNSKLANCKHRIYQTDPITKDIIRVWLSVRDIYEQTDCSLYIYNAVIKETIYRDYLWIRKEYLTGT